MSDQGVDHRAQATPQPGGVAASGEQPQVEAPPDPVASQQGLQEQGDVTPLECFSGVAIGHPQAELECARSLLHNANPPWHSWHNTADLNMEMFESCGMCTLALTNRWFFLYLFFFFLLLLSSVILRQ